MAVIQQKLIDLADIELLVIVFVPCDEAVYLSFVLPPVKIHSQ